MLFLLFRHTDDAIFDNFPKISEDFSNFFRSLDERCQTVSEEDPKMFRSDTNKFKCS